MTDGLGWLSDRQRDGGIDRIPLPDAIRGELWLCGKHAIARRYGSGEFGTVVVLVEPHELDGHYDEYVRWLDAAGDRAIRHPIHDLHAPNLEAMTTLVERIIVRLRTGERVVMHCAAGIGRAGTTAVCVLIGTGLTAPDALATVAAARPGAGPEAGVQRDLVTAFARVRNMTPLAALRTRGVAHVRSVVPDSAIEAWRRSASRRFDHVDELVADVGPWRVAEHLGERFAPTACSLGIEVLGAPDPAAVLTEEIGEVVASALGDRARMLVDASWLRRQRPPSMAPSWHAPHSWHQDGALGVDFANSAAARLRPIVTAWCPLVVCGVDAPGIGYVPGRRETLLRPEELRGDHGPIEAPSMRPGDVLLMMGDLLHRTHVDPAMTHERTSVEVRFVPG